MAVECTPAALVEAAKCYCFDKKTSEQVKILLLAHIAGLEDQTPAQLAASAKCYCYDEKTTKAVLVMLACEAVNALG